MAHAYVGVEDAVVGGYVRALVLFVGEELALLFFGTRRQTSFRLLNKQLEVGLNLVFNKLHVFGNLRLHQVIQIFENRLSTKNPKLIKPV